MKNLLFFASCFMVVFAISSCSSDEKGDLNLRFKLKYGSEDLKMFDQYTYPVTGEKLNFTKVSFYISDIAVHSDHSHGDLVEIDYINPTAAHTAPVSQDGFVYKIKEVPVGEYSKLFFNLGVPATLNSKEPKDFNTSNPLSNPAEYWSAWKSYIFMRNEGRIDLDGDGSPEEGFALHLGGDDAYRFISINKSFSITKNQETFVDIEIDMQKLFNGKTQYDIRSTTQIHSLSQMPLIRILADNIVTGIK
ncbi:MAG: hypothetical protein IPM42_01700 [Saprospiraceae bacterium]|nr:hypothetical protein [Saprospiraceae bacterium]